MKLIKALRVLFKVLIVGGFVVSFCVGFGVTPIISSIMQGMLATVNLLDVIQEIGTWRV